MTSGVTTPCVNNTPESRVILISGKSTYCGNINATTSWGEEQTFSGNNIFDYTFTFTVPPAEITRYVETGQPGTILVLGERKNVKN